MGAIDDIFSPGGVLDENGYACRDGQIKMARAVDQAYESNAQVMIEAPTGSGKSFGYGFVAAHHAIRNNRQSIIVTANNALSEQLVKKDLPLIKELLFPGLKFFTVKGRANYACQRMTHGLAARSHTLRSLVQELQDHPTGDRSDLSFEPEAHDWNQVSVSSEDCIKKSCTFYDECYSNKAKWEAQHADIIVTNYAMLFSDANSKRGRNTLSVLPPYDALILDEAHEAPDIARDFFGWSISRRSLHSLRRNLQKMQSDIVVPSLESDIDVFFDRLWVHYKSAEYKVRFREAGLGGVSSDALRSSLKETDERFRIAARTWTSERRADSEILSKKLIDTRMRIIRASACTDEKSVFFLQRLRDDNVAIASKYVLPGPQIQSRVLSKASTVIATSATMCHDDGNFSYMRSELGLDGNANTLIVPSVFDATAQSVLIVPRSMPDPSSATYASAVAEKLETIIKIANGRTLALFTSHRGMNCAREYLVGKSMPNRILCQGDAPRLQLVEMFRNDHESVLLGTSSFWTGIDVQGPSLSVVVIDRIPFATPDDPVLDALHEQEKDNWFHKHLLPPAIRTFRQGVGRLVRSENDTGIVICLDRRLVDKNYGKAILKSLGDIPLAAGFNAATIALIKSGRD